jgi:hypothetical protein
MAEQPWVYGPLLVLATASVIYGYVRTTRLWDRTPVSVCLPVPRREPQPEPVESGGAGGIDVVTADRAGQS